MARYTDEDETPIVPEAVSIQAILRGDVTDSGDIVMYLESVGIQVTCLADLERINADESEDELHAWRVAEGVAISVASHGEWYLFTNETMIR